MGRLGITRFVTPREEELELRKGMRSGKVRVLLFSRLGKGNVTQRGRKGDSGKEWEIKEVFEHTLCETCRWAVIKR